MNRILEIRNISEAKAELEKIKVSSQGVEVMAPKALGAVVKLTNVKVGAANILKQEMLSVGGDAAVARGVVNGTEEFSDVILLGNADKLKKLIKKLGYQTIFGLPDIKVDLESMVRQLISKVTLEINCNGKVLVFNQTKIMGILNITPDSFSDGEDFLSVEKAVEHAMQMVEDGADIIDVGGESTRPGADIVDSKTEISRVVPVIKKIREECDVIISIDTTKAEVAEAAIIAGADIINDVSALTVDKDMIKVLQKYNNIPVILMHRQGMPKTMQNNPKYSDVIEDILFYLEERINYCVINGIAKERILVDPGIGFGKSQKDNLLIIKKLSEFKVLQVPVLLGASRKSFVDKIYSSSPLEREEATLATTALAHRQNIEIVRVHAVKQNKRLLQTLEAIKETI